MFTHQEVWRGIDRLAKQHGLTASGLARRAGLDPTTFNPSKRITKQNKPRWPSTESLAKILNATATPFDSFVALMPDRPGELPQLASQRLPCLALDRAERGRHVRRARVFRSATSGTRSIFPTSRTATPMRSRSMTTACTRAIARATS